MKRIAIIHAVLAAVLAATAGPAAAAEIDARLSYHWGPKHPSAGHAENFAKRINERSKGRIEIKTFPSGQLFGIREILGAVSARSVELGMAVGVVSFPPIAKNYSVTIMPDLFPDYETMRGFFRDTPEGRAIREEIRSKAGIEILGHNPVGPSAVFSTRERLDTVRSLEGVKARVLVAADRARWEALKAAKMVSLPTGEVYTGLQTGMVDTVNTVPGALKGYSWDAFLKSVQLPYFQHNDGYILVNKAWFDALPQDLRALMQAVGEEISRESTAAIVAESAAALTAFEAKGGKVFTLSPAEQAKLEKLTVEQIEPKMMTQFDAAVLKAAKAYVSKMNRK